jgi:hypothetical protein
MFVEKIYRVRIIPPDLLKLQYIHCSVFVSIGKIEFQVGVAIIFEIIILYNAGRLLSLFLVVVILLLI